ncbi:MAG: hypothetical protein KAJ44_01300 [Thermoplasmatales archaeon]|nr:hypothetical protein [Thermoplasmatales archaeon]
MVKNHTTDIPTIYRIPVELEQRIREEVKRGKTKIQVAEELNVSYCTVCKYTRDLIRSRKTPPEVIKQIRTYVRKYNSRIQAAIKVGVSYPTVRWYTRDIPIKRGIPSEKVEKIRMKVMKGTPKYQVAQDFNLSYLTVLKYTRDLPGHPGGRSGIRGKTLELLKKLISDGYIICSSGHTYRYQTLRKYFPTIRRVNACGKTVIFLEDKSNIAVKALLEASNKKIMSYQELKQITKVFDTSLNQHEKKQFLYSKY